MAVSLTIKRGSRSQIDAAALANGLAAGEPYLITDENRIAIGLTPSTFEVFARLSEVGGSGDLDYGLVSSSPSSVADYGSIA
jgi:hypothetical protein